MVFKKGSRPPNAGEKQADVPATVDTTPSREENVAVADKATYILTKDLDEMIDASLKSKIDSRELNNGAPMEWSALIIPINTALKIADLNVIESASSETVAWEKAQRKAMKGQSVKLRDKLIAYIKFLGFEIAKD